MIELPGVTLACVDTLNQALALRALERSRMGIRFARTVLLTDHLPEGVAAPSGIEVAKIDPLRSRDDYSRFVLKGLLAQVRTPHVLLVQWDGYVVNPQAWDSAFAEVDYLGAKWFWHQDGHDVGNGGFSLRSRRLLEALQDPRIALVEAEDTTIGRTFRPLLERDYGIRFGTAALADRFAFEAAYPIGRPFGFHGLFNFCRVVPAGELAELAQGFSDAILRSPQLASLLSNCVSLNLWQPAIAIARRLLALDPDNARAATILAHSESSLARGVGVGRNDPCPCGSGKRYKQCHGAMAGGPEVTPDALVARGLEAHQRGDLIGAARDYATALAAAPRHPYALHYLGVTHYQRGNPAQALPLLEEAVRLVPGEAEFHNNLGLALASLDRETEAIERYRQALALKPEHAGAWSNLGLALHAQDDPASAVDAYRRALALMPEAAQTRWNMALALLHQGNFDEGWRAYEARLSIPAFAASALPSTAKWDGKDAAGRTILLVAEQGLGDAIQFVRLAKPLAARGARVLVQVPRPLTGLLADVEGVSGIVAAGAPLPPHDAWLPLLSLPLVLGIDAATIPSTTPYLHADAALRREVATALVPYGASRRIGIAWAGSRKNTNDRRRSIPLATMAAALFDLPGTTWISLQQGDEGDDARLMRLPWRNSFEGIAALAAELDLVVSVDTSVAHVAGALARPVFILLPFASDWRWRRGRSDSDWYPTATLFRQPAPGDWPGALARVRAAITKR